MPTLFQEIVNCTLILCRSIPVQTGLIPCCGPRIAEKNKIGPGFCTRNKYCLTHSPHFPIWHFEESHSTATRLPNRSPPNRLMSKDFEISKLLELARTNKYEATVAMFEIIDQLEQIDISKKYLNRKPAVKAMAALSENLVKYDYISDEQRQALQEELNKSKTRASLDSVFKTSGSAAPISDESEEELDEIGETEPIEGLEDENDDLDDDDSNDDDSNDDDSDEDEDDDVEDDSDDDSDDDED